MTLLEVGTQSTIAETAEQEWRVEMAMTKEMAIKGLKRLRSDFSGYKPNEEMFDMAIEALVHEPKTGRWRKKEEGCWYWYECSACGKKPLFGFDGRVFSDYCPNCGSRMEIEDESDQHSRY